MITSTYLKEKKYQGTNKDIGKLREDFSAYGIKVSYSPDEKNRMVIFSATKQYRQSGEFDSYVSECNGLLLKAGSWEPLVIPPRTFKSNVKVDIVNAGLARDEYDIFEAQDGTMVNLYYFDEKWCMSTVKGFNVTFLKWNDKIYNQAFKEVLLSKDVDVEKFYNSLDKTRCYTMCFSHPDFHPFWHGKSREEFMNMTFIQSVDLKTSEVSWKNPFDSAKILDQSKGKKFNNVREIFKELPRSLKKYINTGETCFGYILRFKSSVKITPENVIYSHIFLESRLLQTIRQFVYNGHYNINAREKNFDRQSLVLVNAFLNKKIHSSFLQLFPQYKDQFDKLEAISIKLIKKIIDMSTPSTTESKEADNTTNSVDKLTSSAEFLLNAFTKVYTLNIKARDSTRIISSFILDPVFIDIFYHLFTETEDKSNV